MAKESMKAREVKRALPQDFVKFGLIPEFIGRVPITVSLDSLDRDALIRILKELRDLTGMIKRDNDNVACVISTQKKNEINKVFAEVFKFSLTKQVTSLYELTKIK